MKHGQSFKTMAITINGNGTLTGVSAGGLPDGIVDTDMLAANAVATAKIADDAVTAAKASGSVKGITMADRWGLTGNFNLTNAATYYTITGTWGRTTTAGYTGTSAIGSAMTESSGVFTFPSTGIYYIIFDCITGTSNDQLNMWSYITVGADNTSTSYASVMASSGDSGTMNTVTHSTLLDVTDVSAQKVFFRGYAASSGCYLSGTSTLQRTAATFIRLGDT